MAATWIDSIITILVVMGGLFLLYRAVKEPMDLLFGYIWAGLVAIKDMMVGSSKGETIIKYG